MLLSSLEGGHAACMGGESGGEWIHVGLWLHPFGVHLSPQCQMYAHARKKATMPEKLATCHLCSSKQMVWLSSSERNCVSGKGRMWPEGWSARPHSALGCLSLATRCALRYLPANSQ